MKTPLALFIGWRMLRSPKPDRSVSLLGTLSFISLALSVAVLIVTLSVMNGFQQVLTRNLLASLPQITVSAREQHSPSPDTDWNWASVAAELRSHPEILSVTPFSEGKVLLHNGNRSQLANLRGIPAAENVVLPVLSPAPKNSAHSAAELIPAGSWQLVLSEDLAAVLGALPGSYLYVLMPLAKTSPLGLLPRMRRLKVTAILPTTSQHNAQTALVNIADANRLFKRKQGSGSLGLKLRDRERATELSQLLNRQYSYCCKSESWQQQHSGLLAAIMMEKLVLGTLLALIVVIAAFNLVSMLNVLISGKRNEIAMLQSLGADTAMVTRIFLAQGFVLGGCGIITGVLAGLGISATLDSIVGFFEYLTGRFLFDPGVYYATGLPTELQALTVLLVAVFAISLIVPAVWLPCRVINRITPSRLLRNE